MQLKPIHPELKTLFKTLGHERIKDILKKFYLKLKADTMVGFFFENKDVLKIAEKQFEFLAFAANESKSYTGKNPTTAHLELPPILAGHFDRRIKILEETLKLEEINPKLIQAWVQFEKSFRASIIEG